MKINESVKYIIGKLKKNKYDGYLVGGCVRDFILGKEPKDYDICTNALPEQITEIFKDDKLLLHGLKHGTVTVVLNSECYEITTYRIDKDYKDGRHPETVEFTNDITEDLKRRDFTINAMAYDIYTDNIIDPFGGLDDLKNKKIKCVGNAIDRFSEDALRIMRALRFASVLNFEIEEDTKKAIFELYKNLALISWERKNVEFSKLLTGTKCVDILREYSEIVFFLIPELKKTYKFNQNNKYHDHDIWEHTLHVIESTPYDLVLRLTALLHDVGKPDAYSLGEDNQGHFYGHAEISAKLAEEILIRFRYSNLIKNKVVLLIKEHSLTFEISKKFLKKALSRMTTDDLNDLFTFRKADIIGQKGFEIATERLLKVDKTQELLKEVIEENECFSLKDLEISGDDIIELGVEKGKIIGKTLKYLLKKVIAGEIDNTHSILIEEAKNFLSLEGAI